MFYIHFPINNAILFLKKIIDKSEKVNAFASEALFMLSSIIHLGKSGIAKANITEDDLIR